ncbi:MAG: hypothetical protein AAFZ80_09635 [Cyanobacteria bacterium P01_A01_bin.105]
MLGQTYYLLRSRRDGQYLAARARSADGTAEAQAAKGFLMLFSADYDALSYVNHHAAPMADQFSVEPMTGPQLKQLLARWGYDGIGLVKDPLTPTVEFLTQQ